MTLMESGLLARNPVGAVSDDLELPDDVGRAESEIEAVIVVLRVEVPAGGVGPGATAGVGESLAVGDGVPGAEAVSPTEV